MDILALTIFAIALIATPTLLILGGVAFLRTNRLRDALLDSQARLIELEEALAGLRVSAPPGLPGPTPQAAPESEPPAGAADIAETPPDTPAKPAASAPPPPSAAPASAGPEPIPPAPPPAPEPQAEPTPPPDPEPSAAAPPPGAAGDAAAPEQPEAAESAFSGLGSADAAPTSASPPSIRAPSGFAAFERMVVANWFVWIGGLCLVLAIVFMLRFAVERGYYGPRAQLLSAYAIGMALIVAGDWMRRRPPTGILGASQLKRLPSILAAAGAFAFFAATYAGYVQLHVLGPGLAFALMAAASAVAVALAIRFGRTLAALGFAGAYAAPALVDFGNPSAAALFGYLGALTAAALAVVKLRRWSGLVWIAAVGALLWGLVWLEAAFTPASQTAMCVYLLALAGLGAAFAWDEAGKPLEFEHFWVPRLRWSEPVFAAHVMAASAACILLALALRSGLEPQTVAAIIALCAATAIVAMLRESFCLAPLGAALVGIALLLLWPAMSSVHGGEQGGGHGYLIDVNLFFTAGASLGFVFSAGGWLMMGRNQVAGPGATLAALGPAAVIAAAHARLGMLGGPLPWTLAALFLALLSVFALERIARRVGGVEKAAGASAAFALGAVAATALAFTFALSHLWLSAALSVLIPACAWLDGRFRLPALRVAVSLLAAWVVWRLVIGLEPLSAPVGTTPLFNALAPGYGIAIASFWQASRFYRRSGVSPAAPLVQALEAGAMVLGAAFISMEVRHLANHGDLTAPVNSLFEAGAHVIALMSLAIGLSARFGKKPPWPLYALEALALLGAIGVLIVWQGMVRNPWWGVSPASAPGMLVLNALLVAYGLPAALLGAYAVLRRRQGLSWRAAAIGVTATMAAFVYVTLEVRRLFHPGAMSAPDITQMETWALSAAWVGFALAVLGTGLIRNKPSLRYVSLIVLLATILKAFAFDMSALNGAIRALSFLGLGAAIVGVAIFYQRFIFPRTFGVRGPGDPNLMPPR